MGWRKVAASFIEEGVFCERPDSRAVVTVNLSVGYAIWAVLGIVLTTIIAVAGQHVRPGALAGCRSAVRLDVKRRLLNATSI